MPGYVWPDVPVQAWRLGLQEIERTTRAVLTGTKSRCQLAVPVECDARALGTAAFTAGMGPLLGFWIEQGRLETEPELAALLGLHLEHGRRRADRLEAELLRAVDVLSAAGVSTTVIKGMHTAWVYYPEPGTRPLADIDVLVAPADLERVERALKDAGYEPVLATRVSRPFKCDWVPPAAPRTLRSIELTHADNPYTLDVHTSLDRNFLGIRTLALGSPRPEELPRWRGPSSAARVLAQPLLTAYLAAHTAQELRRVPMTRLVELALVLRRDESTLDLDALLALLRRLDGLRLVYPAFALTERLLPGTVRPDVLAELEGDAPPAMRRLLARLEPATAQQIDRFSFAEALMWARGPLDYLRLALFTVWPFHYPAPLRRRVSADRFFRLIRAIRSRVTARAPTGGAPAERKV